MKKLFLLLFLIPNLVFSEQIKFKDNDEKYAFCKQLTNQMAYMMPIRADRISFLDSVVCIPGNPPQFTFSNVIELDFNKNKKMIIDSVEINSKEQKNLWCTDPGKRYILENFNIEQSFRDINGVFIDKIKLNSSDC